MYSNFIIGNAQRNYLKFFRESHIDLLNLYQNSKKKLSKNNDRNNQYSINGLSSRKHISK